MEREQPIFETEGEDRGKVKRVEAARKAAWAEKPFRDALVKYRERFSSVAPLYTEMIADVADQEGREAIEAWEKERSSEDSAAMDALRNLAKRTITLAPATKRLAEESQDRETVETSEELLKRIGLARADKIIADVNKSPRDKMEAIGVIGNSMNSGAYRAIRGKGVPSGDNDATISSLEGYFAAAILMGNAQKAIQALAEVGKLENREPEDYIQSQIPLILELREKYPQVNRLLTEMIQGATVAPRRLDRAMEGHGFLWSPESETYIFIGGEEEVK